MSRIHQALVSLLLRREDSAGHRLINHLELGLLVLILVSFQSWLDRLDWILMGLSDNFTAYCMLLGYLWCALTVFIFVLNRTWISLCLHGFLCHFFDHLTWAMCLVFLHALLSQSRRLFCHIVDLDLWDIVKSVNWRRIIWLLYLIIIGLFFIFIFNVSIDVIILLVIIVDNIYSLLTLDLYLDCTLNT